jgi:hypothetical protein
MDENKTEPELFEIKLDEKAKYYIMRVAGLATAILITMLITAIIYLVLDINRIIRDNKLFWDLEDTIKFRSMPWISIVVTILNIIGVTCYVVFLRRLRWSIKNGNQAYFSESFKYLLRNSIIFLVVMALSTLMSLIVLSSLFL